MLRNVIAMLERIRLLEIEGSRRTTHDQKKIINGSSQTRDREALSVEKVIKD